MDCFNWLHFSDLHLTPKQSFDSQYARKRLLQFLHDEASNGRLPCDYVFFTGDIADKGNYDGVQDFIPDLFGALNWKSNASINRAFWAVGNHDIPRKSLLRSWVIDKIRAEGADCFEECMNDTEIRKLLHPKVLDEYSYWHERLLGRDSGIVDSGNPHAQHILPHLNLIVLNTCLTSCDEKDDQNLHIKESGLQYAFDGLDASKPTFVIGHHGREFFERESQEQLGYIFDTSNVDLYLCGHSHKLGHAEFPEAGREIHQITCGGGVSGKRAKFTFLHGYFDGTKNEITIKPYSYADEGNRSWQLDRSLHRKLDGMTALKLTGERREPTLINSVFNYTNDSNSVHSIYKKQLAWSQSFFSSADGSERSAGE